ncbi:MAG: 2-oxoacid:acceptor oxidoreductase family protein [Verrucomicrobia bacterium]|nr:2-oxoacid:acceptor oxidoreductase family protein [Verrucomicrobiota bacterium]
MNRVTNVVVAGLGGQGVLKGTDILADVVLRAGYDVKKSEIKGMSQRGGSVTGEVRFGNRVFSPMVSAGEADFLLVLEPTQVDPHRHMLRPGGVLIAPDAVPADRLPNKKTLNVALLGALSAHLPMAEDQWLLSLQAGFAETFFEGNQKAFQIGRGSQLPSK